MSQIAKRRAAQNVVDEQLQNGVRLGRIQQGVLRALLDHGSYPGGWMWDTHSHTAKVLDSLAKRGLVERTEHPVTDHRGREFPEGHPYHGRTSPRYQPSAKLRDRLAHYTNPK